MERENTFTRLKPDAVFLVSEVFPEGFEDDLVAELASDGAQVESVRMPAGPRAGMELFLPTAAALFIASSYFTGFVQKAGENHYDLLTTAAKRLFDRVRGVRTTAVGTLGKVSKNPRFSLTYSIIGEIAPRLQFKLLLETELDQTCPDDAIRAFLSLLRNIHSDTLSKEELETLLTYRPVGGTVIVTFDPHSKSIVPVHSK